MDRLSAEFTGPPIYDETRQVLRAPMKLEPGRTYRVWLQSERFQAFASADGAPLAPVSITFTTAAKGRR